MSSLGFNTGYIEELYKQYLEDPNSVSESWREFFADYNPDASFVPAAQTTGDGEATTPPQEPATEARETPPETTPA
ncbi:MAG: hypothetical protein ABEK84_05755, partial [Salinibacter sp.]